MPFENGSGREMVGELRELARLFTKLGFVAFGGPVAHVAMMLQEVVERRRWMDDQEFLAALIAVVALVLLFRFKTNSAWLVVAGGAVGLAVRALSGG